MSHGYLRDADNQLRKCSWIFSEVGIEALMESCALGDDDLADAFRTLGVGWADACETTTAGQIEITLEKIRLGGINHGGWKPAQGGDDKAPGDASKVPHTVRRDAAGVVDRVDAVIYERLPEREFATFKFFYRDEVGMRRWKGEENDPGDGVGGVGEEEAPAPTFGEFTVVERRKRGAEEGEEEEEGGDRGLKKAKEDLGVGEGEVEGDGGEDGNEEDEEL